MADAIDGVGDRRQRVALQPGAQPEHRDDVGGGDARRRERGVGGVEAADEAQRGAHRERDRAQGAPIVRGDALADAAPEAHKVAE